MVVVRMQVNDPAAVVAAVALFRVAERVTVRWIAGMRAAASARMRLTLELHAQATARQGASDDSTR
jgi:hypothetical protein